MDKKVTFFLGANTPSGFYSLYDQMLPPASARRVFLLKGGAGCGKSSLMRKVGSALEDAGEKTEYIVCSGDPGSLDAVIFPDLKAAIVDATAPHGAAAKGRAGKKVNIRRGCGGRNRRGSPPEQGRKRFVKDCSRRKLIFGISLFA